MLRGKGMFMHTKLIGTSLKSEELFACYYVHSGGKMIVHAECKSENWQLAELFIRCGHSFGESDFHKRFQRTWATLIKTNLPQGMGWSFCKKGIFSMVSMLHLCGTCCKRWRIWIPLLPIAFFSLSDETLNWLAYAYLLSLHQAVSGKKL